MAYFLQHPDSDDDDANVRFCCMEDENLWDVFMIFIGVQSSLAEVQTQILIPIMSQFVVQFICIYSKFS